MQKKSEIPSRYHHPVRNSPGRPPPQFPSRTPPQPAGPPNVPPRNKQLTFPILSKFSTSIVQLRLSSPLEPKTPQHNFDRIPELGRLGRFPKNTFLLDYAVPYGIHEPVRKQQKREYDEKPLPCLRPVAFPLGEGADRSPFSGFLFFPFL